MVWRRRRQSWRGRLTIFLPCSFRKVCKQVLSRPVRHESASRRLLLSCNLGSSTVKFLRNEDYSSLVAVPCPRIDFGQYIRHRNLFIVLVTAACQSVAYVLKNCASSNRALFWGMAHSSVISHSDSQPTTDVFGHIFAMAGLSIPTSITLQWNPILESPATQEKGGRCG